jgi:hypothetical protein
MAQPLAGIRVLDMGTFITGPACGMLLADLGAEVIKVEMPETGDPFRAFKGDLYSPHFQTYNRGKKSITLNTKKNPEDLAALDELVKTADVFIENFRPGVAERLGVGAVRQSTRALSMPRSPASAAMARGGTGRPLIPSARLAAAFCACWSTRPIRAWWGQRSGTQ